MGCADSLCLRDRAELQVSLPTLNDELKYVKWDFFVPNTLVDEVNPLDYHKVFQLKANHYDSDGNGYQWKPNRPILGMSYVHEENATDNIRDLYVLIQSPNIIPCDNMEDPNLCDSYREGNHRITINDAIKKGEWNEIIYKFNFSTSDSQGYFQIWVNRKPVIIDPSQTLPQWNTYYSYPVIGSSSTQSPPSKIFCANVYTDNDPQLPPTGDPMANYFKFGHHRRNHLETHSIYIDNIRITNKFPPQNNSTRLISSDCDITLLIEDWNIECYEVPNSTNYKFRFNDGNTTYWVNSNVPTINLLDYSFIQPNTTYTVDVRAQGDNFDYSYGQSCSITTPFLTKIIESQCNTVMHDAFNNYWLSCHPIPNTTNYKFRFKDGTTTYWINSSDPSINLANIGWFQYDKWYDVQVRVQGANFDFDYGECCSIRIRFKQQLAPIHSCGQWNITYEPKNHGIYPNPVETIVSIKNLKSNESYQIYDWQGNIIREGNASESQNINLSSLRKGIYFVKIYSGENSSFYKLIKE